MKQLLLKPVLASDHPCFVIALSSYIHMCYVNLLSKNIKLGTKHFWFVQKNDVFTISWLFQSILYCYFLCTDLNNLSICQFFICSFLGLISWEQIMLLLHQLRRECLRWILSPHRYCWNHLSVLERCWLTLSPPVLIELIIPKMYVTFGFLATILKH